MMYVWYFRFYDKSRGRALEFEIADDEQTLSDAQIEDFARQILTRLERNEDLSALASPVVLTASEVQDAVELIDRLIAESSER